MGKFRPAGLDGPPPSCVSFSPTALSRHTVEEHRGTKRLAEDQLPGQLRVKAARGLDYNKHRVEAEENNLSDQDHIGLCELIDNIHNLADQLTRLSPSRARALFEVQIPQLEMDLERAKGAIEKKKNKAMRKAWGPRSQIKK